MRPIASCTSIEEVRANIDRIDHELVSLLAERSGYVMQVVRFKTTEEEVHANERAEQVVSRAIALAHEMGANPIVTERVYRAMIAAFIEAELVEHAARKKN